MRVRLVLGADGSMALAVDNEQGVTFEEAKFKLDRLTAILGDLPIVMTGEVERHIHDDRGLYVHYHEEA